MASLLALAALLLPGDVTEAEVDALFADYDRPDAPGCVVGVVLDGELVHAKGYGMADLEHDLALGPRSVLRIGSTSKQFTAACVLLAEAQGRLSLDDDVRLFVPELPGYGEAITIRQLLHHTSGLRDYLGLMHLAGKADRDFYTSGDVLEMLARQRALNFEPGERHLYSNSGYLLLGVIVERATGLSLRAYAEEKIFGPLGMGDSRFYDDTDEVVRRRAEGYVPTDGGDWKIGRTTLDLVGDGAVFTTLEDLARWDANFYDPVVGGERLLEGQHTTGELDDGTAIDYAAGLSVSQYRGLRSVSHGGSFIGFRAQFMRFPEQRFSVICLANRDDADPSRRCRAVADLYLADAFSEPAPEPRERGAGPGNEALDEQRQAPLSEGLAGRYWSPELAVHVDIVAVDGGLSYRTGHVELGPFPMRSEDEAREGGLSLRFTRAAGEVASGFELGMGRVQGLVFERADAVPATPADAMPGPEAALASIVAADLQAHVDYLASDELAGRYSRGPEARLAAAYIAERFERWGLTPMGDEGSWYQSLEDERIAPNVVGALPGSGSGYVLLMAHYDHLRQARRGDDRIFNGADDNASGTSAVLELAQAFSMLSEPLDATLVFLACTAEEQGLQGSHWFVSHPPFALGEIRAAINMDMISRGEEDLVFCESNEQASELIASLERHRESVGLRIRFGEHPDWLRASDHWPFMKAGVPTLYLGVEDHEDYHKVTDHADRILPGLVERVARLAFLTSFEHAQAD